MTPEHALRSTIIGHARELGPAGLSLNRSGNISARCAGGFLVTPTGMAYEHLEPDDVAFVPVEGRAPLGQRTPSSEWRIHQAVYRRRPDVGGIVHCHSTYATAVACTGRGIPAFHYSVAGIGGESITCSPYATFGSEALARNVAEALSGDRRGCLMANHGQIACGPDLVSAFALARDIEELALQYVITLQIGGPNLLDDGEMGRVLRAFAQYGQQTKR
jgi:L-fuculose-phosphate aldolase